jgi:hypothetical protein
MSLQYLYKEPKTILINAPEGINTITLVAKCGNPLPLIPAGWYPVEGEEYSYICTFECTSSVYVSIPDCISLKVQWIAEIPTEKFTNVQM